MVVTISHAGYIKRSPVSAYRAQKRGGKGKAAAKAKDEDFIQDAFVASTHAYLLTFTTRGRVFWLKVHQLPEAGGQARGRPIVNLIQLEANEQVCTVVPVRKFPENEEEAFLFFCTKNGVVKKTDLTQYSNPRSTGLIACGIEAGDDLISVAVTDGKSDVFLTTAEGMSIRFNELEVRTMGRQAVGVNGIRLAQEDGKSDDVVSMEVISKGTSVLTVTERGFGKRTNESEYPLQHRAGMGVITIKTTERNGRVAGAIQVNPGDQAMLITNGGTLIRINTDEVSEISRNTQGVRLINVDEGEKVIAITRIAEPSDDTTPLSSQPLSVEGPADEDNGDKGPAGDG